MGCASLTVLLPNVVIGWKHFDAVVGWKLLDAVNMTRPTEAADFKAGVQPIIQYNALTIRRYDNRPVTNFDFLNYQRGLNIGGFSDSQANQLSTEMMR